jgi:MFS family permease
MAPAAIFAPLVTTAADRGRRERVLLAIAGSRAAVTAVAALVVAAGGPTAAVYAIAGIVAIVSTLQRPTQAALLPSLASIPDELTASNVSMSTIESLATLIGPAVAGLLLVVAGPATAFVVAAPA